MGCKAHFRKTVVVFWIFQTATEWAQFGTKSKHPSEYCLSRVRSVLWKSPWGFFVSLKDVPVDSWKLEDLNMFKSYCCIIVNVYDFLHVKCCITLGGFIGPLINVFAGLVLGCQRSLTNQSNAKRLWKWQRPSTGILGGFSENNFEIAISPHFR